MSVPPLPSGYQPSSNAAEDYLLFIKFEDAVEARTEGGTTYSLTGWKIDDVLDTADAADAEFEQVLTNASCPGLAEVQTAAEQRSGRPARDLASLHRIHFTTSKTAQQIADLANDLIAHSAVEFASMRFQYPSPPQSSSTTPDFTGLQSYFGPDPGADFDYAHSSLGLDGDGIRVTELSITYDAVHEDLQQASISMEQGFDFIGFHNYEDYSDWVSFWIDHGSATLGMLFAGHNGYGTDGLAVGAEGHLYPTRDLNNPPPNFVDRSSQAFCNAIVDSAADGLGNVIYIEGQSGENAPAEVHPDIWELTRLATDAGVVVLGAAGNGNHNMDHSDWDHWRSCGDSGSILVGSGTADQNHDRMPDSSYGARIGPHGWGEGIVTLGCGDLHGGDPLSGWIDPCPIGGYESTANQRYTDHFGGTSGATPMVTAAAILVQEHTINQGLTPLDSVDMRSLLIHTGIPQGAGVPGDIGPFINVKEAIQNFDIADLVVQTTQVGNTPFTTFIANQGPRVAQNVEVEIVYGVQWTDSLTPINVPDGCEPLSFPEYCAGSCPATLECEFDRIEPNQPVEITFNFCGDPALGGVGTLPVDAEAQSTGELTDDDLSNNVDLSTVNHGTSCGSVQ